MLFSLEPLSKIECTCMHSTPEPHSLDPNERVVELVVNGFYALHGQLLAQHTLVERQCEATVDELPVEEGLLQCTLPVVTSESGNGLHGPLGSVLPSSPSWVP
uniref:Putative suppressor of deltex n=1 Tax=Ixodes ricinus TaxID=34613 RepID=A0A0K8RCV4_IXORI